MLTYTQLGRGVFHIKDAESASLLTRYAILSDNKTGDYYDAKISVQDELVVMSGEKTETKVSIKKMAHGGYALHIPIKENERFFGLGDAGRDTIMHRGRSYNIWVANVSSYGPIPLLISSLGYAILVNSTHRQKFDIGDSDKDTLSIYSVGGAPDFYLFSAGSIKECIRAVTDVTGRPAMLPAFAYGLTYVENENVTTAKSLLDDIKTMRDRRIPCDTFGLEPLWMGGYDFSVDKAWDKDRFYIPYWLPKNTASSKTFFGPMRFMGMQLSLWLCEEYDLFYEEEREAVKRGLPENRNDEFLLDSEESFKKNIEFLDSHLVAPVKNDKVTKPEEPWFEHLKKFVDNGASCFKLDGSNQVLEHPQRYWAEKYSDAEAHNVYPIILAKQMSEGFSDHTGRRSMIYTAGAYTGIQKYAATWAGDTGGGPRTLTSALNYAMCGHTNTSCDLDLLIPGSVHYSFLSTWTQINNWAYYDYPWYMEKEVEDRLRFYSELRSSLFPYIYSAAHNAYETGMPVVRPLALVYEDEKFDNVFNGYMLGDSLYVGAFDMNLTLPEGKWIDYFTGKVYEGDVTYEIPEGCGGALLVKCGSVFVTMTPQQYILEREHEYIINVYPGGNSTFELYEDDGFTFDYKDGGFATTRIALNDKKDGFELVVSERVGSFVGRADNGHNIYQNSIPKIDGIKPVSDMKIKVFDTAVKEVILEGENLDFVSVEDGILLPLTAQMRKGGEVKIEFRY